MKRKDAEEIADAVLRELSKRNPIPKEVIPPKAARVSRAEAAAAALEEAPSGAPIPRGMRLRTLAGVRGGPPARSIMAVGVGRDQNATSSPFRLSVRVYKGAGNYHEARRVLKALDVDLAEVDMATGVKYTSRSFHLTPGISGAHIDLGAGTLGAIVNHDGDDVILSCNHVLTIGPATRPFSTIIHPSRLDSLPGARQFVGNLLEVIPLTLGTVDAAIATLGPDVTSVGPNDYGGTIGIIDPRPISELGTNTDVIKRGRTTGETFGEFRTILKMVEVNYGSASNPLIFEFEDVIEIVGRSPTPVFSASGDSGSLILAEESKRPFGLLFAGGKDNQGIDRTLANPIGTVLKAFAKPLSFIT